MGDMTTGVKPKSKMGAARKYDRVVVVDHVCAELMKNRSLLDICTKDAGLPEPQTFMEWVLRDDPPGVAARYAHAREIAYRQMADEIDRLAAETHTYTLVPEVDSDGNPIYDDKGEPKAKRVLVPLSADVMASKRLQIDTKKWLLSKVLPKIYGDKVTQEHTGADGGPIAIAAVNLRNLNDDDLEKMNQLMLKAKGGA